MMCDFNECSETVMGEPVVFRRLTLGERKSNRGEISPFSLLGRVNGGDLELWKSNGRWRENDKAHPRDLAISETVKG